VSKDRVLLNLF